MIKRGYCPWCGADIAPMAYSQVFAQIEWDACRTRRCRGNNLELITDFGGWVLEPKSIEGKYVGSKKITRKK